jgi:hypothetical protein
MNRRRQPVAVGDVEIVIQGRIEVEEAVIEHRQRVRVDHVSADLGHGQHVRDRLADVEAVLEGSAVVDQVETAGEAVGQGTVQVLD